MNKKHLLLLGLMALSPFVANAKDFYEFDNVKPEAILKLFLEAQKKGRKYPTVDEFKSIGVSAADIEFIRSHVKRRPLIDNEGRLNKSVYKDRKVFMCTPMGSGAQGAHGYPTNAMDKTDVYSMWNYTSTFGSWNHGFFQAPGCWADAAHKNGTKFMSGQMFFESMYGGADDGPWVNLISKQEGDKYIYVEPFLNALMFFGHDGIVYNWEASRFNDDDVVDFHKALYAEAKKRNFIDYNSLIYTSVNFTLSNINKDYLYGTKDEPIHELFLNYPGGNIQTGLKSSEEFAENQCGGVDRLYAGVHINQMQRNWEELKTTNKLNLIVWGEHTENMIYTNTKGENNDTWQKNYQTMQERFFSGGNNNPANRPSAASANGTSWQSELVNFCGLAEYMPERSALSTTFQTHFNLGNGKYYYSKGAKTTIGGWYNMASQDVVPTYRWLVYNSNTTSTNSSVKPQFTHEDAYVGGTCLNIKGNAANGADVILYRTDLTIANHPVAKVAVKRNNGAATIKLILHVDNQWKEYNVDIAANANWNERTITLDELAGKKIDQIGLRVNGDADINVGKLELSSANRVEPKAIKGELTAETVSEGIDDITIKLNWTIDATLDEYGRAYNSDNNIDHFEVFVKKDNEEIEVGRTSQWATIASHVPFAADAEDLEIGVRSVSTDLVSASPIVWTKVKKGAPDEKIDPNDTSNQGEFYKVNYNKKAPHAREDRYMMHVGLYEYNNGKKENLQQYPDNDRTARITKQFYLDVTNKAVFDVEAGKTYNPYIAYHGLWMSGYVYIDWNNDGKFDYQNKISFNGDVPTLEEGCEVVSFSAHNNSRNDWGGWYNNNGRTFPKSTQFPKDDNIKNWLGWFKVPEGTKEGSYRIRFKLDWNNLDPAGSDEMLRDGGDAIDAMINVHAPNVKVGAKAVNGSVMQNGTTLTEQMNGAAKYKTAIELSFKPNNEYKTTEVEVRHGYNLGNESGVDAVGNRQWWAEKMVVENDKITIPEKLVNADILVVPTFSAVNGIENAKIDGFSINDYDVYNVNGQLVRKAKQNTPLQKGVYIVKGRKFIVK